MSKYTTEISNILEFTLVPKMKRLVSSIALIEPYTIDSKDLRKRYAELQHLTSVYDYLHEYEVGNEEMSRADLQNIIRLIGNMSINLQPEVYTPANNYQTQPTYFDIYLDGALLKEGDTVPTGLHTIKAVFRGTCAVTKLIFKQKLVGAPGNTVIMQNASVTDPGGTIQFKAYGNNNILLVSAILSFITGSQFLLYDGGVLLYDGGFLSY